MKYNILLVDDMYVNRALIKTVLSNYIDNINYLEAADGRKAIELINEKSIDLIILDLLLPDVDGYEILNEIKKKETTKNIPVIINSSIQEVESMQTTLGLGALDYFIKPLTVEQMKTIVPIKVRNALLYNDQRKLLVKMNEQIKEELRLASILQTSLIPEFGEYSNGKLYGIYKPSKEIGGDIYDCIQVGESLWFIIADVTGHGVASAMVSVMIKAAFTNAVRHLGTPKEVLENMNNTFCNMLGEENDILFSAFVGVIKEGRLYYSNAGHPYPVVLRNDAKKVELLNMDGHVIGFFNEITLEEKDIEFEKGDCIFCYTDGLFDISSSDDEKDWDYMLNVLKKNRSLIDKEPKKFLDQILDTVRKTEKDSYKDDITLMLITSDFKEG